MVLLTTASIFDPLGLLTPAVIAHNIYLQKLWHEKPWDELFPAQLQEWNQLLRLFVIVTFKITRKVICSNAIHFQLHGFCDSSE
jgi:hypothetical protein